MNKTEIEKMVYDIVEAVDYDSAKQLYPETAEEPEFANELREQLVSIAQAHMVDLLNESEWLSALEEAGVDNWEGISFAHELMET